MAKVAFLSFYSGVVDRGVETYVLELGKRLAKKHNVSIFQSGHAILNEGIRAHIISLFISKPVQSRSPLAKIYLDSNSLKILLFTICCIPRIIKNRYDVVIPMNGGWQLVIVKIVSMLSGFKVLVSGQAGIGADDAWNLYFKPDAFVALTKTQKTWAERIAPETRVEQIPNGVDLAKFNPLAIPLKCKLKKPIVICASALVPNKRVDLTIRAVAKAKLSLLLLGEGQLKGSIDPLGKRLLGEKYERVEAKYEEIEKYYRLGNVFTLVSKNEAFGTVYLEAMACNIPVVATNDDSRAEIIGDAGILTSPEDINTYAKDLEIASKTDYRNIPYNQALKFSWNKVAISYDRLIKQMFKKSNFNA